jgi:hypothetical protein
MRRRVSHDDGMRRGCGGQAKESRRAGEREIMHGGLQEDLDRNDRPRADDGFIKTPARVLVAWMTRARARTHGCNDARPSADSSA